MTSKRVKAPDPSPIAAGILDLAKTAIADGAVAAVIVYETRAGKCFTRTWPALVSTRVGLLNWATAPDR